MKAIFEGYKCIDGTTNGPDTSDLCQTKPEMAPWLAIGFGEMKHISVERVTIFNVLRYVKGIGQTKDLTFRLTDELPKSSEEMSTDGEYLGEGLHLLPEGVNIDLASAGRSNPGWEKTYGRYLLIQMDNKKSFPFSPMSLNLKEVFVHGIIREAGTWHSFISMNIPVPVNWICKLSEL